MAGKLPEIKPDKKHTNIVGMKTCGIDCVAILYVSPVVERDRLLRSTDAHNLCVEEDANPSLLNLIA